MARKKNNKSLRQLEKVDLFIVDGKTEKWYLELYKRICPSKKFDIKPELSVGSLESIIELIKSRLKDYENIYWIVDLDVLIKEDIERKKGSRSKLEIFKVAYLRFSKKSNVHILVNNPCFEYWILLHFKFKSINSTKCGDILSELEKIKDLDGYSKSEDYYKNPRINLLERVIPNLPNAIKNAKNLGDFDVDNPTKPVVEIYKLFTGYF